MIDGWTQKRREKNLKQQSQKIIENGHNHTKEPSQELIYL